MSKTGDLRKFFGTSGEVRLCSPFKAVLKLVLRGRIREWAPAVRMNPSLQGQGQGQGAGAGRGRVPGGVARGLLLGDDARSDGPRCESTGR